MPVSYVVGPYTTDPTVLYVTTDQRLAQYFAAHWVSGQLGGAVGSGDLYEVEPVGTLRPDPDYHHSLGLSWVCTEARIRAVYQREVKRTRALEIHALRFTTWDDGSPMYDETGHLLPDSSMRTAGIEPKDFRDLGPLAPHHAAVNRAAHLLASPRHPS